MPKLKVASFSISIDGYGAGPDQSLENPLGFDQVQALVPAFAPTRGTPRSPHALDWLRPRVGRARCSWKFRQQFEASGGGEAGRGSHLMQSAVVVVQTQQ
mgnify:CR=1 FL=1